MIFLNCDSSIAQACRAKSTLIPLPVVPGYIVLHVKPTQFDSSVGAVIVEEQRITCLVTTSLVLYFDDGPRIDVPSIRSQDQLVCCPAMFIAERLVEY